jgi:hypothetical protein
MNVRTMKFLTATAITLLGVSISAAPATRALPGDLPKPLAQMTSDELFAFGASLRFDNGPVQDRDCARGGCLGRIDAVREQTPGPGSISANGTIVARLVNLGGRDGNEGPESRYQTARGRQEFYLIALKTANGWSWTVREAARNGSDAPRETASGTWTVCRHDPANPGHPKGRSQFASCTGNAGASDELMRSAGPRIPGDFAVSLLPYNPGDPGWLSCSDGCCTAGQ